MEASAAESCKGKSSSEAESVPEESCLFLGDLRRLVSFHGNIVGTASDFNVRLFVSKYKKSFSLKCLEHTFVYFVTLKSSLSGVDADRLILTFQA